MKTQRIALQLLSMLAVGGFAASLFAQSPARLKNADGEIGGIWLGPLNISPFLNVSGLYDSNVDFVRDGEKASHKIEKTSGYSINPGFDLLLDREIWKLDGRGFFKLEDYSKDFAESRKDWGEALNFSRESDGGTGLRLSQMAQKVLHDDTDFADRWNDRLELRLGANLVTPLSEKSKLGIAGKYSKMDYDDSDLYDWDRVEGALTLSTKLSDKTDGVLVGGYASQSSDGNRGDSHSIKGNVGIASRPSEKTNYRATIGAERFSGFDDDDSEVGLSYELGLSWKATERLGFRLSGTSAYRPAEDTSRNSMLVSTLGALMSYRPLTRWHLTMRATYRREDYTRDVAIESMQILPAGESGRSRTDDQMSGEAVITYGINSYASIFVGGDYTILNSSIDELDYKRWRVNGGVALRY